MVTGLDSVVVVELAADIGVEEVLVHRDLGAIGEHESRIVPEFLDEAENIVPPAAVESGRVLAQLPQDLVHLEGGRQRLDQDSGFDGPGGNA